MDLQAHFRHTLTVMNVRGSIVVGVSGGADSLAMMHLFREMADVQPHVVHVHHGIRGSEADEDAAFVAQTAEAWGMAHRVVRVNVPELADKYKLTIEEAARKARYTIFAETAKEIGGWMIAVAHNADDQAETVLMHLLRGAGLAGLRGMQARTRISGAQLQPSTTIGENNGFQIIRPLLDIPRSEIDIYCQNHNLQPRVDSTNTDTAYTRNRIRLEVIPALEQVGPTIRTMLGRTAKILAADYEVLQEQVHLAWDDVEMSQSDDAVVFKHVSWVYLPLAIRRELIRMAVNYLTDSTDNLSFEQVEHAVTVAQRFESGLKARLPDGLMLHVMDHWLVITRLNDLSLVIPDNESPLLRRSLQVNQIGIYKLPESDWSFQIQAYEGLRSGTEWNEMIHSALIQPFAADSIDFPLVLQQRSPDLTFYPQGVGGSQSLKKFMNQAKIPAHWRKHVPILTHGTDVIWVCGYRVDERFIVHPETERIWVAQFERNKNAPAQ